MTDDLLPYLNEAERRWGGGRWNRWCPHKPTERQAEFLALDCREALYGGAAGGGKSDALLMASLQYVHVPGYSAMLLRRTFADLNLPEAIMDRAKSWLIGTGVHWNDNDKCFTFPSGAKLTFGYMDNDRDRFRYQSASFQFIGWDEMTQFPELWVRYMFSRLRKPKSASLELARVPLRMRGATNPGGIGHKWVKKRYVDKATAVGPFVPSLLADNPHVDAMSYQEMLAQLDPTTRAQLEKGLWVQDSSGLVYGHFDRARNLVAMPNTREGVWRFVLANDFGFSNATSFVVLGWKQFSPIVYVIQSEKKRGLIPSAAAARDKELEKQYGFDSIVGDVGGLGKGYAEEMRQRHSIPIKPAQKANKGGYIKLVNGAYASGELLIVDGTNDELVEEIEELPWADEEHSAEAEGFENHCCDGKLYGWREVKAFAEEAEEAEPADAPEPTAEDVAAQLRQAHLDRWQQRQDGQGEDWFQRRFR